MYPDAGEWLENLSTKFLPKEDLKSRLREMCFALLLIGFSRDHRIVKSDFSKSEEGARNQFLDVNHICAAMVCDVLVTSDKACAKLAFAAYEALKLNTSVLLVLPDMPPGSQKLVGPGFWP